MLSIGIDVGGTFTDFFGIDKNGNTEFVYKEQSTPADPSLGVIAGLNGMARSFNLDLGDVAHIYHGTTVGTNAILEHRGAKVGLITNSGFRDILQIGRHQRPEHYSIRQDIPWQSKQLIQRKFRKTVNCRLDHLGNEITPLDEPKIYDICKFFKEHAIEAVLVAFLFSYRNNSQEERAAKIVHEILPNAFVTTSSRVSPQFREFERFTTGAVAAFIGPKVKTYINNLNNKLNEFCPNTQLRIMTSNGGLATPELIVERPELTLLSGLVAGANAGSWLASKKGLKGLITLDIGGTSADIAIINDGKLSEVNSRNASISGFPVQLPMIDINTIGAGGGSIARLDQGGAFRVGPQSSGADPGPACYGRDGVQPTVTDANLILGRLPSQKLLEGRLALEMSLAEKSFANLSGRLGTSLHETAEGSISVLNNNMANAIRSRTTQKGIDPRNFTLCAFGGAGPLHAVEVAEILGIKKVIIPKHPGIMCAIGLLASKIEYHSVRTAFLTKSAFDIKKSNSFLQEMETELLALFKRDGIGADEIEFQRFGDFRYVGQGYELRVPFPEGSLGENNLDSLWSNFHEKHQQEYGHCFESSDIELVSIKLKASKMESEKDILNSKATVIADQKENVSFNEIYFNSGGEVKTFKTRYTDRKNLQYGKIYDGPLVVLQPDSTIVIPPNWQVSVEEDGNLTLMNCDP